MYAGSGKTKFYKELNTESFPNWFSDPIAYEQLELEFLQIMEREREWHLTEFDTFGEKLREFIDAYPSVFYGVNTWWVSGYEDWQFIYDHLDDYNKFKIKQWKLANDESCFGES